LVTPAVAVANITVQIFVIPPQNMTSGLNNGDRIWMKTEHLGND